MRSILLNEILNVSLLGSKVSFRLSILNSLLELIDIAWIGDTLIEYL